MINLKDLRNQTTVTRNMIHAEMPVTAGQRNHARFGALQTRQNRLCQNKNLNNKRWKKLRLRSNIFSSGNILCEGNPFLISRIISHNICLFKNTAFLGKCSRVAPLETGSELLSIFARDAFVIFPPFSWQRNSFIHEFLMNCVVALLLYVYHNTRFHSSEE